MANPERQGFRERVGNYAIGGGIVAGLIGLVLSPELFVGGTVVAAGGYVLKQTAKKE